MEGLIQLLIIFAIYSAFTASARKKKNNSNRGNAPQQKPMPPIYRQQEERPYDKAPSHPYSPVQPSQRPKQVSTSKPIQSKPIPMQMKPVKKQVNKKVSTQMSSGKSLEGVSLEGYSLEGIPLEYDLHKNLDLISESPKSEKAEPLQNGSSVFSREEIVRGIVMSEILGKPKALRR